MGNRCALFVDAGYLLAAAATRATGTSLRSGIHVRFEILISRLVDQVECASGLPLLRVHWYDSARNAIPDSQQERIGELPQVKLRLGRFGMDGQQKGVDLRIGLDLVNNARNRNADVIYLLSGDDDLSEAVEEAQAHGVQVVVLAVPAQDGKPHGVSRHLVRAADSVLLVDAEALEDSVLRVEVPPEAVTVAVPEAVPADTVSLAQVAATEHHVTPADLHAPHRPVAVAPRSSLAWTSASGRQPAAHAAMEGVDVDEDQIEAVVRNVVQSLRESASADVVEALRRSRPTISRDIDRALLVDLSDALGVYDLSDQVRTRLRACFWEIFDIA